MTESASRAQDMPIGIHWSAEEDEALFAQLQQGVPIQHVIPPEGRSVRSCRRRAMCEDFPKRRTVPSTTDATRGCVCSGLVDAAPSNVVVGERFPLPWELPMFHQLPMVADSNHADRRVRPIPPWGTNMDGIITPMVTFQC